MAITYTYTRPIPGVTPGPAWASYLNDFATNVRGHNHSGTDEVKIVPASININTPLTFNTHAATALAYANFTPNSGNANYSVYVDSAGDLYYRNGTSNLRITNSSGVFFPGTPEANGFYGDYANALAQSFFSAAANSYSFYGAGGGSPSRLYAGSYTATLTSSLAKPFQHENMGLEQTGFYLPDPATPGQFGANPWLGFVPDAITGETNNLVVGADYNYFDAGDYKLAVVKKTDDAAATEKEHTLLYWLNSAGTYGVGSGYQMVFASEHTLGGGAVRLARIRAYFSGASGATSDGGLQLRAQTGGSPTAGISFTLQGAGSRAALGPNTGSTALAALPNNNTFYSDLAVVPVTDGTALGTTTGGNRRWALQATTVTASSTVAASGVISSSAGNSTTAAITASAGPIQSSSAPASNASILKGSVYNVNQVLAWGLVDTNSAATYDGFNIAPGGGSLGTFTVTFATSLSNSNYAVVATAQDPVANPTIVQVTNKTSAGFRIKCFNSGGGDTDARVNFIVVGRP